jgi:hypothetical protein
MSNIWINLELIFVNTGSADDLPLFCLRVLNRSRFTQGNLQRPLNMTVPQLHGSEPGSEVDIRSSNFMEPEGSQFSQEHANGENR